MKRFLFNLPLIMILMTVSFTGMGLINISKYALDGLTMLFTGISILLHYKYERRNTFSDKTNNIIREIWQFSFGLYLIPKYFIDDTKTLNLFLAIFLSINFITGVLFSLKTFSFQAINSNNTEVQL